jgi:membrane protein implicated in regulation of membrane protease activity
MGRKALMMAFEFDEQDLAANRLGQITDAQRDALRSTQQERGAIWWGIYLTVAALAVTLCGVLLLKGASTQEWLFLFSIIVPVVILVSLLRLMLGRIERRELQRGQISSITGTATTHFEINQMILKVGNKSFEVSPGQSKAVQEGQTYTVYYLRRSNLIVAIEPVDESDGVEEAETLLIDPTQVESRVLGRLTEDGELVLDDKPAGQHVAR